MPEIHFFTGNTLSNEAITAITAGTAVGSLTAAEAAAKNRRWSLLAAASGANMPYNPYRRLIIIDNSASTQDAFVVINAGNNPASTTYVHKCEAGGYMELTRALGEVGPEVMSVVMGGTTVAPCVVTERSAI